MLSLEAIAVLNFGTTPTSAPAVLPTGSFVLAGIVVPISQLYLASIVIVAAAALAAVYRYSRFGLATRAGAENDVGAALIGLSANRIAAQNSGHRHRAGHAVGGADRAHLRGQPDLLHPVRGARPGRRADRPVLLVRGHGRRRAGPRRDPSEIVHLQTVFTWLPQQGLGGGCRSCSSWW